MSAKREGADSHRDQEMARLLDECGWTQQQIAEHVSKRTGRKITQAWVSFRLKFRAFLKFITARYKSDLPPDLLTRLTEFRFRNHWAKVKKEFADLRKQNRKAGIEERFILARAGENLPGQ